MALRLSEGLGFFGERQKAGDIRMKQFFRVWDRLVWRRVAHVVEVVAMFAAIFLPCSVESSSLPPWQGIPKFCDNRLQIREGRPEGVIHGVAAFGPVDRNRIEPNKSFEDGSAELDGSGAEGDISLDDKRAEQGNESGQEGKDAGGRGRNGFSDVVHAALLGVILVAVPMYPVFMAERRRRDGLKKPNVRAKPDPTVGRAGPGCENVQGTAGRARVARRWGSA